MTLLGAMKSLEVMQMNDQELATAPMNELITARKSATTQEEQNKLANAEHRAYARETVGDNPAMAASLAVAIPAYYVGKKTGIVKGRSEATVEQMGEAFKGVGEGLANSAENFFGRSFSSQNVKEKASQIASKALDFFGVDFGTKIEPATTVTSSSPVPAPSNPVQSLFQKVIQAESGGKHTDEKGNLIKSKVGAEGITQLMPKTAKNPGYGIEPVKDKSEAEYLRVGREYLSALYKKFDGDAEKALAAYNWGVGKVSTAISKAERFGGDWKKELPKETQNYLAKILGAGNAQAKEK